MIDDQSVPSDRTPLSVSLWLGSIRSIDESLLLSRRLAARQKSGRINDCIRRVEQFQKDP